MQKKHITSSDVADAKIKISRGPEIDYSVKTHRRGEEIIFGIKLFAATVIFILMLWLLDR